MRIRGQTPNTDQSASFVVHHQLIDRAFHPVNLPLDLYHDLLDAIYALGSVSQRQLDSQGNEHH